MSVEVPPSSPFVSDVDPLPVVASTVLVTGASGLLGTSLCRILAGAGSKVVAHARSWCDRDGVAFPLENIELIEPAVRSLQPDWIIHAAGNTNVDACERDPVAAHRLHVEASAELARAARNHGCRLIYVSTDSVYDGARRGEHDETSDVRPINVYARTKREGEQACLEASDTTIVARLNFFGLHPTRRQGLAAWLLENLRAGRSVNGFTDVWFNPLFSDDLAGLLARAIQEDLPGGVYNFGAADRCSKYEFARGLAGLLGVDAGLVRPVTLTEAGLPTPRPRHTVTRTHKLSTALRRSMPTIEEGLRRMLPLTSAV
ncbi:MAG TPA: SDR family oxidoreductase [Lacunisphaera sp.]|nr:SDR family oxidoreductase [Lacunisphaera sp.]